MGDGVIGPICNQQNLRCYQERIQLCLDALGRMLAEHRFAVGPERIGLELELHLIDDKGDPAMTNQTVLELIGDSAFQAELGQHNIEINVRPRLLADDQLLSLEQELKIVLDTADRAAHQAGAGIAMIGILPTLRQDHFDLRWVSPKSRYVLLNEQILAARRGRLILDMEGVPLDGTRPERLLCAADSILPESGCTSAQLHLQVPADDFAAHWNAAQALAGVQVALAANSPFLLARALWQETRIPLFEQSTDTRSPELRDQGVRPRVWFGERWITSIFDLFEENVQHFPPLLSTTKNEEPLEVLAAGGAPALTELRLHNSTIWRWNRPVYDAVDGVAHLRIENRVLPAGPTVIDVLANAAFFFGAMHRLTQLEPPIWHRMPFAVAQENLCAAAKHGMAARLYWPDFGWITPDELVLRELLSLAHEGLHGYGVSDAVRQRYLGVIEQRCLARRNGAIWQRETVQALSARGTSRKAALAGMLARYVEYMHAGEPVHLWPAG